MTPTVNLVSIFLSTLLMYWLSQLKQELNCLLSEEPTIWLISGLCEKYFPLFVLIHKLHIVIWSPWIDIRSSAYPPVKGQSHSIQKFITKLHPTEWNSFNTGISPSSSSFRSGIQRYIIHPQALCRKCSLPVVTSKTFPATILPRRQWLYKIGSLQLCALGRIGT